MGFHFETTHKARVKLRAGLGAGNSGPWKIPSPLTSVHSAEQAPASWSLPIKPSNAQRAGDSGQAWAQPSLHRNKLVPLPIPAHPRITVILAPREAQHPDLGAPGQAEGRDPALAREDQRGQDPRDAHSPLTGDRLSVESLSPTHSQGSTLDTRASSPELTPLRAGPWRPPQFHWAWSGYESHSWAVTETGCLEA